MEPGTATPSHIQPPVTLARIKAALEQVPVNRLNDVYEYLIELQEEAQEEAEDLASIAAARAEFERTGERGVLLEDYLRERGLLEEVEAAAKAEEIDK